ncbi:MAG: phosphoribosyltransferase family protein [Candidatus Magasanikbacteria bacterium]|nr:phosphoribosyltransferase family protein [Candidatus Magasanikbacteria bacterium]
MDQSAIERKALQILAAHNAVVTGDHFVYTAGDHGPDYVNKNAVTPHVRGTYHLSLLMAEHLRFLEPQIIIGAVAVGAVIADQIAWMYSAQNPDKPEPLALLVDKVPYLARDEHGQLILNEKGEPIILERLELKRGYNKLLAGQRVVVGEDIVNTGATVKEVVRLVREAGGIVVAVVAMVNRGETVAADFGDGVEFYPLVTVKMPRFPANVCPLCAEGRQINTTLGHGAAFVRAHGQPRNEF